MARKQTAPQLPVKLPNTFYCRAKRRRLTYQKCLDDYVSYNAFTVEKSVCYRCPQGLQNRKAFAGS